MKRLLLAGAVVVTAIALLCTASCIGLRSKSKAEAASAMDCVLEWGRLAPFPQSAKDLTITAEGGSFTRAFRAKFTAPPQDINAWIASSLGTKNLVPERAGSSIRKYVIAPGGGAAYAKVVIDDQTNLVTVYVYWS